MAITFWRNVQRKITTQEMDASFDTLVNDIANAGLSSEMPEGTIYVGDNTNFASLETLDTSIVPSTLNNRYVTDANLTVIGNTSGNNTGDNATNTTSNAYADSKVADEINDGTSTIAPSQNAVFDALAIANNQIAYETWSTNSNYTTINTTAKRLIVLQTGTLTATRTLTLSNVTSVGQEVLIVAGGSVTSTNKILVTCGNKINVTLSSFDIVIAYSQTLLTSVATDSWTSQEAVSEVFVDDGVTLTTTRRLKAGYFAGGINTSFPSMIGFGDFTSVILGSSVGLATYQTLGYKFIPSIDGVSFWTQEITGNVNLQYYNGTDVGNGSYALYTRNTYYGGWNYFSVSNPTTYIEGYYYNVGTITQLIITKPTSNSGALQVALSGGKIAVTTNSALTFAKQQLLNTWLNSELPQLYESWSTNGQIKYLTQLGVGHTSQNASAILQADSTTKGFLTPRMTASQRASVSSPATGLEVYQTDAHAGKWYYNGTAWIDTNQPRTSNTTSSATPTINTDIIDYYELTAQTSDITSFTTNLSGTPVRGQKLWIDITGTSARAITWGASFEASTIALPTTTVTTNKLSVGFIWNVATSKWRIVGTC